MAGVIIKIISGLLTAGKLAYQAYKILGAESALSIEDAKRLAASVNVNLFAAHDFSKLTTTQDKFYSVYLPSITSCTTIHQGDITGSGYLTETYHELKARAGDLWDSLQALDWIFTHNNLHPDDYNFFGRMIGQGYTLLFHMYSVIINLRSVEILDAVNLDNRHLLPESLTLLDFINKGLDQVSGLYSKSCDSRLSLISEVWSNTHTDPYSHRPITTYAFKDSYSKLSSTESNQALDGSGSKDYLADTSKSTVSNARSYRYSDIYGRYHALTGNDLKDILDTLNSLKPVIETRASNQKKATEEAEQRKEDEEERRREHWGPKHDGGCKG